MLNAYPLGALRDSEVKLHVPAEKSDQKTYKRKITDARALIEAGRLEEAQAALTALSADKTVMTTDVLGERTALGMPRKLHSAWLKLAKAEGDAIGRVGLQHGLVPDPAVMAPFITFDADEKRLMAELGRKPVPRIIHQIWIGSLPLPPAVARWESHAKATGFEYRLWREADLEQLGIASHPAYLAMLEDGDYPGAVDVARYAILLEHGGIYLDCDWYPTREDIGFGDLLPLIGLGAIAEDVARDVGAGSLLLANSFIATPPGHPAFAKMLAVFPDVMAALPQAPAWWSTGPLIMTMLFRQTNVFLAPFGLVAASLKRGAPIEDVEKACADAVASGEGLLVAWKSW